MLRRSGSGAAIFSEPLIYRDKNRLVMKDICRDIDRDLNGDLGSIYVQLHDRKTAAKAGASFWNLDPDSRSFNIAYQVTENTDSKDLTELIHDVLDTSATRAEIIKKLMDERRSYIVLQKGKYFSTELGQKYIGMIPEELKTEYLTAQFEEKLEKIGEGELSKDQMLDDLYREIDKNLKIFSNSAEHLDTSSLEYIQIWSKKHRLQKHLAVAVLFITRRWHTEKNYTRKKRKQLEKLPVIIIVTKN